MRKYFILFSVAILLSVSFPFSHDRVEASVVSDVSNVFVRKAVKEVVLENGVKTTTELIVKKEVKDATQYAPKAGFKAVCLDKKDTCNTPAMIKDIRDITPTDKELLASTVEKKIEESSSGKYKNIFEDLVREIAGNITVDLFEKVIGIPFGEDIDEWFDSIIFDSFKELGWLVNAVPDTAGNVSYLSDSMNNSAVDTDLNLSSQFLKESLYVKEFEWNHAFDGEGESYEFPLTIAKNFNGRSGDIVLLDFFGLPKVVPQYSAPYFIYTLGDYIVTNRSDDSIFGVPDDSYAYYYPGLKELSIYYNDAVIFKNSKSLTSMSSEIREKVKNVISKTQIAAYQYPVSVGDTYITTYLIYTNDGNVLKFTIKHSNYDFGKPYFFNTLTQMINFDGNYLPRGTIFKTRFVYHRSANIVNSNPIKHSYDDMKNNFTEPSLKKDDKLLLPPVSSLPMYDGFKNPVGVKFDASGKAIFTSQAGDNVNITSYGDLNVKYDPDGKIVVIPPSTPTHPKNDPIVIKEPTDKPGDGGGEPGGGDNPGEKDNGNPEGINWQKLKLIPEAFTKAFPFSIPWDIANFLENTFKPIDGEKNKLEFKLPIVFLQSDFTITVPEMFMGWFKHIRTFMLILFDLGLIYAVRKMYGGAS